MAGIREHELGCEILTALRIPIENVRRIEFVIDVASMATISVHRVISDVDASRLSEVIERYQIAVTHTDDPVPAPAKEQA